jgi:hypothetical protein
MKNPKNNLETRRLLPGSSTDHAFVRCGFINVLKFRILASTSLLCVAVFLVSSSLLLAKPRSKSITDICNEKAINAYDKCVGAGSSAALCGDISNKTFSNCMIRLGYFGNIPAKSGALQPPGTSPSPSGPKPIHPISAPVTSKGPVSSPTPTPQTIYAKPKSTPRPAPQGHHG